MSSRLTWTVTPSGRPGSLHSWTGVGVIAKSTVSLGFCMATLSQDIWQGQRSRVSLERAQRPVMTQRAKGALAIDLRPSPVQKIDPAAEMPLASRPSSCLRSAVCKHIVVYVSQQFSLAPSSRLSVKSDSTTSGKRQHETSHGRSHKIGQAESAELPSSLQLGLTARWFLPGRSVPRVRFESTRCACWIVGVRHGANSRLCPPGREKNTLQHFVLCAKNAWMWIVTGVG